MFFLLIGVLLFSSAECRSRHPILAEPDWDVCGDSGCVMPNNTWLVITKQRSGSRWLVDTMETRSGGMVPGGSELRCNGCFCGEKFDMTSTEGATAAAHCSCSLQKSYRKASPSCDQTDRHIGFKFMVPGGESALHDGAFDVLARSVCHLNIPVIFMWRRNVLRRLISFKANVHDSRDPVLSADQTEHVVGEGSKKQLGHEPHPVDPEIAALLREYRPEIDTDKIAQDIAEEERVRRVIERSFKKYASVCDVARNAKTFYYEDLVDGAPGAAAKWGELLSTLRIWKNSDLAIIHGEQHVRDTIANARGVKNALKETPFKWMIDE